MTVNSFEYLAIVLGLLPQALLQIARARRDRPLWEIALDVPFAFAVDLLLVLALAWTMPLAFAALVARGVWLVGAVAWLVARSVRRRRAAAGTLPRSCSPGWPEQLRARTLAAAGASVAVMVGLSSWLSRSCHNFDRGWHIPLVASLGGQRVPFVNVYQPEQRLEYHFMGDVFAALLQACSLGRIHSTLALSLAHDLLYALVGLTVALLLWDFGVQRIVYVVLAALGVVLTGPLTLFADTTTRSFTGYNFINFFKLSYRPHVPLAALLVVGFIGAALVRAHHREQPPPLWRTASVLAACVAALTLTDESSVGLLGLGLGAGWLVLPGLIAERRLAGIGVLVGLLGCLYLPHLAFGGVLGPGRSEHWLVMVPWRSPGYYQRPIPFTARDGFRLFAYDIAPFALAALGGLAVLWRRRGRGPLGAWLFYTALLACSVFMLCRTEARSVGPEPLSRWSTQGHRFMTALMLAMPLFAAFWLGARGPRPGRRAAGAPHAVATTLLVASVLLASVSTLEWIRTRGKHKCVTPGSFGARDDLFVVDCRQDAGARFGRPPTTAYGQRSVLYLYAGCQPSFLAAQMAVQYSLKVGGAASDREGLAGLDADLLEPDEPLAVICAADPRQGSDRLCGKLLPAGGCRPLGRKLQRCELGPRERKALLAEWPATRERGPKPSKRRPAEEPGAGRGQRGERPEDPASPDAEIGLPDDGP